jgi:hypothetical protein
VGASQGKNHLKSMKTIFGLFLVLASIAAGIYFGLIWAFIGGIVTIITQLQSGHIAAMVIACAIARIVLAGLIGWLCAILPIAFGVALLQD